MKTLETKAKQALRMRRFLMAVATYAACGALAQVCAWLGYLPHRLPMWWVLGAVVVNGVFFTLLRSGWNMRLRDPSMTEPQLFVSMAAAMVLIAQADGARGALLMLLPVPLLFGVLRLNFRQMARVGAVGVAGYAAVIAALMFTQPGRDQLSLELLDLTSLSAVTGFICLMGGYISKVHKDLAVALAAIGELADHDPLTGLFNRRNLMERLEIEMAGCRRNMRHGVAVCMVDIDHFKRINDTLGHLVGDQVLVLVGKCLEEAIRVMDYVARFGGEEFIVLLDAGSDSQAVATCERIRMQVEQLRVERFPELTFSVSIGVAYFAKGDSVASMIERADSALYLAKASGRNCVHVATVSEARPGALRQHPELPSSHP